MLNAYLNRVVDSFSAKGWAEGTKRTYRLQVACYMDFCDVKGLLNGHLDSP
jgi:hypothetical protein